MTDQWDEKAEALLTCEHTVNPNSAYSQFSIERCYACEHRPAVAAELRKMGTEIERLKIKAFEMSVDEIEDHLNKENVFEPLIEELREAISHRNERIIALKQEVSDHRAKNEKLRELASHNLDEREKLIDGIRDSLKFLNDTRHTWNGPIHRAVSLLEGLVHSWHERYHQENPNDECRFCYPK